MSNKMEATFHKPGDLCREFLGYGWQEECTCCLPKGHDGPHTCEHTTSADPQDTDK